MTPELNAPPFVAQLSPYIPGLTTPVVGFSGGVHQLLLENHGSTGLICILRTYAGQLEGDFIELFCSDLLVCCLVIKLSYACEAIASRARCILFKISSPLAFQT